MRTMNERPVCHRSEDLVTYLYNEASATDAQDFAKHVETCEACRAEFAVFSQVHESILLWRNEALGSAFSPAPQAARVLAEATFDSRQFVRHERKLPALAALREFFSVSPLWLRGATAFAALLLCVLAVLVISGFWNKPVQVANNSAEQKMYTETQFKNEVAKQVDKQILDFKRSQTQPPANVAANRGEKASAQQGSSHRELASNRVKSRSQRGLTRAEREQLAADLRLTSGRDDEELPFVFPDEPNQ
ncbi:MAG TPA: zf-HC2 domain-containing protein [Pyrinomonadaceae bacterium]|nr:zf-HC2 domain-containing protein [Pyrinomonadaceae bacterium]